MRFSGVQRRAPRGDTSAVLYGRDRSGWSPGAQRAFLVISIGAALLLATAGIGVVSYVEANHGGPYTAMRSFPGRVAWVDLEMNAGLRDGLPPHLTDWALLALDVGVELHYHRVSSLAELDVNQYSALILSDQERLSDREWELALEAARGGVALIFTGHPGLQRSNGARRTEVLLDEFDPGSGFTRTKDPGSALVVAGSAATVAGLELGSRVGLDAGAARLVRRGLAPRSGLVWDGDGTLSASGRWSYRGTPVLWLAADIGDFFDRSQARILATNVLAQALRRPSLALRNWPEGASGAFVISESEAEIEQIQDAGVVSLVSRFDPDSEPTQVLHVGRYLRLFQDASTATRTLIAAGAHGGLEEQALASLEQELDRAGVWTPRSAELLEWWRARASLQVQLIEVRPGEVKVRFRNPGPTRVDGATARVYLPDDARIPRSVTGGTLWSRPVLRLDPKGRWVDLVAGSLPPERSQTYAFTF